MIVTIREVEVMVDVNRKKLIASVVISLAALGVASASTLDFDFDWRFSKGDFSAGMMPAFDDSGWRTLNVPHDWSIEGPYNAEYASGTGYAPGGIAWYRKHFKLDTIQKDQLVAIEFDGVYNNSQVWINGILLGTRPYGYASFQYDMTPYLKFGNQENILAVRVDHTKVADSRWYTGSGIYRHVRLRITNKFHIAHWGTYITTPDVNESVALIRIETTVMNDSNQPRDAALEAVIVGPDGAEVARVTATKPVRATSHELIVQQVRIPRPQLWSLESPKLYTVRTLLKSGQATVDEGSTPIGIRTILFDANKGFLLNGKSIKLKGVCIHHDAGCLGSAVPERVLERRLRALLDLGVNAIRCSHNPPAPELLDICDRIGLLVQDEGFDEFTPPKNKWVAGWNVGVPSRYGYGEVFTEWSVRDMEDLVQRDRNHPCVIMWSIGNEIDYANDPFSHPVLGNEYRPDQPPAENLVKYAKPLVDVVKRLDPTRPTTAALANIPMSNAVGMAQLLDVVGYNYQENLYPADHKTYPNRFIYGSENHHLLSDWAVVRDNEYVGGQFLWTGIDYLGEAREWPNRSSDFGLLDLAGFKKPMGWFRQSLWSDKSMVYLIASTGTGGRRGRGGAGAGAPAEQWNWPQGATVSVQCYTNCPQVSLSLNGKAISTQPLSEARQGVLSWQVPFEPGELKAVGRKDGKDVCEFVLKTAGAASRIELSPDVKQITADGKDICHVTFRITDDKGVRVFEASPELTFAIEGPAQVIGIENGDRNSAADPKALTHKAYQGQGLVILQSARQPGKIRLTAKSQGLTDSAIELQATPAK
jgi:beta-galactosidase